MSNPNTTFSGPEWDRPADPAKPLDPDGQPRGDAGIVLPIPATFNGSANFGNRNYDSAYDEAMGHSRENAERMRLDPVIGACLRLRAYPTALLTSRAEPDDDEDPVQVEHAMKGQKLLMQSPPPGFTFLKRWLLEDGTFKGRSGAQVRYQWTYKKGRNWHLPTLFRPIDGDKLVFGWDNRVGILVQSGHVAPHERLANSERGRVYYATPEERQQLIVHEFEPEDASFYKPRMAGAIHGTGLRGKLYWLWALKDRIWAMGMDFLQWFARGLTVYYFPTGNNSYYSALVDFVKAQDGSSSLFIPRGPDDKQGERPPVDFIQPSTASPQFLQQLITGYFDDLFKLNILGQTLTSGTASTGLGSGVSEAHQETFANFVKYDAMALGETLTRDLLKPFYDFNFPGVPCGRWVFDIDNPNVQQMIENAEALYQMGAAVAEEPLMDAAGLALPKTGQTILTNLQGMQPAAVGTQPTGVPTTQAPDATQPQQLRRYLRALMQQRHPYRKWAA